VQLFNLKENIAVFQRMSVLCFLWKGNDLPVFLYFVLSLVLQRSSSCCAAHEWNF